MKKQYWVDFECFCVEATNEHEAGKVAAACIKAGSTPAINSIEWTGDPASGDNLHPVVEGINESDDCVKED